MTHRRSEQPTLFEVTACNEFDSARGLTPEAASPNVIPASLQFSVDTSSLGGALDRVQEAMGKKSTIPILSRVLVEAFDQRQPTWK